MLSAMPSDKNTLNQFTQSMHLDVSQSYYAPIEAMEKGWKLVRKKRWWRADRSIFNSYHSSH
jgi:hypothetical protein